MNRPLTEHQERLLSQALAVLRSGISIIPVSQVDKRPLGSQLPRMNYWPKDPRATAKDLARGRPTWKPYQTVRATEEDVERWIRANAQIAVVGGRVSGGLLILDVDEPRFQTAWGDEVGDLACDLPAQQTGGGGFQTFLRCPNPGANDKLAYVPDPTKPDGRAIAIETRAEGGYAIIAPSLHPSGNTYRMLRGDLAAIPFLSQAHADALLAAARKLDEAPLTTQQIQAAAQAFAPPPPRTQYANGTGHVIDEFNRANRIESVMQAVGYTHRHGDRWAPPGAPRDNDSVQVYPAEGRARHFDTNFPFGGDKAKDAFDIWKYYKHHDDQRAAVKAAANELCMPMPEKIQMAPTPVDDLAPDTEPVDDEPTAEPAAPTPPQAKKRGRPSGSSKTPLWERWRDELVDERARLLWSSYDAAACVQLPDHTVLAIASDEAALWFQERCDREAAFGSELWKKAAGALRSWIKEHGQSATVYTRAHTDFDRQIAYIGIEGDKDFYKVTDRAITIEANGTDGMLIRGGTAPRLTKINKTGELAHWLIDSTWADPMSKLVLALYAVMLAMGTAQTYSARPLLLATGEKGSGKTTTLMLLGQAVVGAGARYQMMKKDADNETRIVSEQLSIFDNVDNPPRGVDIEDFLATSSTSMDLILRKLYSNAEITARPIMAFVAATSFNLPGALKRSDIIDRSLQVHFTKEGRTRDPQLRTIRRELLWADLLCLIRQALALWSLTPTESDLRSIAYMRLAHALVGADIADRLEQHLLEDQRITIANDDLLARCLEAAVPHEPLTAGELLEFWQVIPTLAAELAMSPEKFTRYLNNRAGDFGDWRISKAKGRSNMTLWSFQPKDPSNSLDDAAALDALQRLCQPAGFTLTEDWQDVPDDVLLPGGPRLEIAMSPHQGYKRARLRPAP